MMVVLGFLAATSVASICFIYWLASIQEDHFDVFEEETEEWLASIQKEDADDPLGEFWGVGMKTCPKCGSENKGDPIPEEYFVHDRSTEAHELSARWHREFGLSGECDCLVYGDLPPEDRFYSTVMGYEKRGVYDGVLVWGCGACGHLWPRVSEEDPRYKQALAFIQELLFTAERI